MADDIGQAQFPEGGLDIAMLVDAPVKGPGIGAAEAEFSVSCGRKVENARPIALDKGHLFGAENFVGMGVKSHGRENVVEHVAASFGKFERPAVQNVVPEGKIGQKKAFGFDIEPKQFHFFVAAQEAFGHAPLGPIGALDPAPDGVLRAGRLGQAAQLHLFAHPFVGFAKSPSVGGVFGPFFFEIGGGQVRAVGKEAAPNRFLLDGQYFHRQSRERAEQR